MDENASETIDFGEFCCLVKKMWDADFYGIKSKTAIASRKAEHTNEVDPQGRKPRKRWTHTENQLVPLTEVRAASKRAASKRAAGA